jgi:CPA1 family monovalent cation:H+ antiporter
VAAFDIAAVLAAVAAVCGYVNHRFLRLPATSGTLAVALVSSLALVGAELALPQFSLRPTIQRFLGQIDFNQTLMHGMLCFLLFAGALHVDLGGLLDQKRDVVTLATAGVVISTAAVGGMTWLVSPWLGIPIPLMICLAFGALISPTDPIAVMGLLKELRAPASLEAQIAGESLFNDGVGVVVFFAILSLAGVPDSVGRPLSPTVLGVGTFFVREVAGGVGLGLVTGYVGYRALRSIDEHSTELLITLALAMFLYALSFWVHVSGPLAVVVAGLLIGNPGRQFAMSARTREHVDGFWSMIDEVLNAILFLLIGLELFSVQMTRANVLVAAFTIPIVLFARLLSVGIPMAFVGGDRRAKRGLATLLTWSGLRGGISVAMALSLPAIPEKNVLLTATYAVVLFSVLVQGLTMRRVLLRYGVGLQPSD